MHSLQQLLLFLVSMTMMGQVKAWFPLFDPTSPNSAILVFPYEYVVSEAPVPSYTICMARCLAEVCLSTVSSFRPHCFVKIPLHI